MRNRIDSDRKYSQSPKGKYTHYKHSARDHKRIFNITFDDFKEFWQKPCEYCGEEIPTVGLDRVDSSKGYEIENIASCCYHCNTMKNSHTVEEFIEHCRKIVEVYDLKESQNAKETTVS